MVINNIALIDGIPAVLLLLGVLGCAIFAGLIVLENWLDKRDNDNDH